jgi:hypothetical protein
MTTMHDLEGFIQPSEVSAITGVPIAVLARLRYDGRGPRYYKPTARIVLYKRDDVIEWLESSVQTGARVAAS